MGEANKDYVKKCKKKIVKKINEKFFKIQMGLMDFTRITRITSKSFDESFEK